MYYMLKFLLAKHLTEFIHWKHYRACAMFLFTEDETLYATDAEVVLSIK